MTAANGGRPQPESEAALKIVGVSKTYGGLEALRDVGMHICAGEVVGVVGDNGAGKSTLMKIISGVIQPTSGHLDIGAGPVIFSSPIEASEAGIATVYQDLALAPQRTIVENFFLGREVLSANWLGKRLGWLDNATMERETQAHLEHMNVKIKRLDTPCGLLSGGQRQALAIARAAAWSQKVLLLDEPTSALGVAQHKEVLDIVRRSRDHGLAVMLVSHQMPDILAVCDRVVVLRLGRVVGQLRRDQFDGDTLVAHITGAAATEVSG